MTVSFVTIGVSHGSLRSTTVFFVAEVLGEAGARPRRGFKCPRLADNLPHGVRGSGRALHAWECFIHSVAQSSCVGPAPWPPHSLNEMNGLWTDRRRRFIAIQQLIVPIFREFFVASAHSRLGLLSSAVSLATRSGLFRHRTRASAAVTWTRRRRESELNGYFYSVTVVDFSRCNY